MTAGRLFARRSIAFNTLVQFTGKGIFGLCALFLVGMLTRTLGADGFGMCTTLFAWISTLIVLADMGLYMTGIRHMSVSEGEEKKILGTLFQTRLLFAAVVAIAAAFLLSAVIPYPPVLKNVILAALPAVILVSGARSFKSWFQSRLIMHFAAAGEVSGCLAMTGLTVILLEKPLFFSEPVYGVAAALLAGCLVTFTVFLISARAARAFRMRLDFRYMKTLVKEAFPLGLSALMAILYFRFDMLMLSWMKPATDVGVYGAAYTVVEMSVIIPALFLGSMLPYFTKSLRHRDDTLGLYYQKSFDFLAMIALPILAGGLLLAHPIMVLITGTEFGLLSGAGNLTGATAGVFKILVSVSVLMFWGQLNGHLLVAGSRQMTLLRIYYFLVPLNVLLNLILIPPFSYYGAAAATLISEGAAIIITSRIILRAYHLKPGLLFVLKVAAASVLMAGLLALLHFHVILLVLTGIAVYFSALFLFFKKDAAALLSLLFR